jgi:hypothetical protein
MTTEYLVECDGCGKQLLSTEYVLRFAVYRAVNHAREGVPGWVWERPMIKVEDPPNAPNYWSDVVHYCGRCYNQGLGEIPCPTQAQEETP